eukprot:12838869-Prorocentrum_lima.AAC.1
METALGECEPPASDTKQSMLLGSGGCWATETSVGLFASDCSPQLPSLSIWAPGTHGDCER